VGSSKSSGNCSSSENGSLYCEISSVINDCGDSCSSSGCVNEAAVNREHPQLDCGAYGWAGGIGGSPLKLGSLLLELSTWRVLPDESSSLASDDLDEILSLTVNNTKVFAQVRG